MGTGPAGSMHWSKMRLLDNKRCWWECMLQAEHTHRHQTVVFRSGETCPEAGSKSALPSDKPGALPIENGFPLNSVRVQGQSDPVWDPKTFAQGGGTSRGARRLEGAAR
jgi:hypothetical protein